MKRTPARRTPHPERKGVTSWLVFAAALGFLAGMLVMAAVVDDLSIRCGDRGRCAGRSGVRKRRRAPAKVEVKPSLKETPPPVSPPPEQPSRRRRRSPADPFEDLRQRHLTLPVEGIKKEDLRDNFNEMRGSRRHEAIDVLAPRNTPVLAVEDGKIAKLFYERSRRHHDLPVRSRPRTTSITTRTSSGMRTT